MKRLKVKAFGPLADADISFGDLTILVGPQASGKSIFLQLLKLLVDKNHIRKTFQQYSYEWDKNTSKTMELYFGDGMSKIWRPRTEVLFDDESYDSDFLIPQKGKHNTDETLFYIPAQRILSISDGRPKTFTEFDFSAPYVLRHFSETLRRLMQNSMDKLESIFPIRNRLKKPLRDSFNNSIFHDGRVVMDERSGQKKLRMEIGGVSVPFLTWSAGQKEFMPLLMGFYWLSPPSKVSRKDKYKFVVIEEPEMGLHPQAVKSVILQIIDLLSRDYKVIVSTHSNVLLEFAWAFNFLKSSDASVNAMHELFEIKKSPDTRLLFHDIFRKSINTFYFHRTNDKVISQNITTLDAGSDSEAISEWGGLSHFSTQATDIVSKYLNNGKK